MIDTAVEQLREAIVSQHGGEPVFVQSMPVREASKGETVWEGVGPCLRPRRPSQGHAGICVVIPYRGKRQATVLRGAAYGRDQVADRRAAGGDRGGGQGEK